MILMLVVLVIASIWIEVKVIRKVRPVKYLVERYSLAGVALSLTISAILGSLFGAAGVIVFIAGLASTMGAAPFRAFSKEQASALQKKIANAKSWAVSFKKTYRPVGIFLKYLFIILLAPIWIPVLINRKKNPTSNAEEVLSIHSEAA